MISGFQMRQLYSTQNAQYHAQRLTIFLQRPQSRLTLAAGAEEGNRSTVRSSQRLCRELSTFALLPFHSYPNEKSDWTVGGLGCGGWKRGSSLYCRKSMEYGKTKEREEREKK